MEYNSKNWNHNNKQNQRTNDQTFARVFEHQEERKPGAGSH